VEPQVTGLPIPQGCSTKFIGRTFAIVTVGHLDAAQGGVADGYSTLLSE
jgi:hypothetical protein